MTVPWGKRRAGIWKHTDFPAPVGMMASTSFPAEIVSMISFWTGRNVS